MKKQFLLASVLSLTLLGSCGINNSSSSVNDSTSSSEKISSSNPISSSTSQETKYSIKTIQNLSEDFFTIENTVKADDHFKGNEEVTLTLDAGTILSNGFTTESKHLDHIYINVNGVNYKPAFSDGVTFSNKVDVTFPMPKEDVDIVACYSTQQHLKEDGYSIELVDSPNVSLYGIDSREKYDYIDCFFMTASGFKITSISYAIGTNDYTEITSDSAGGVYYSKESDGVFALKVRPNGQNLIGNVKVKVSGLIHNYHNISYTGLDEDYINKEESTIPDNGLESDTVRIWLFAKNGCYVSSVSLSNVLEENILENSNGVVSFIMPDSDVSVDIAISLNPTIEVSSTSHVTSASIYDSIDYRNAITNIAPNNTFDVLPVLEEGYLLIGGYINGENYIDFSTAISTRYLHFTMPEGISKATISFKVGQQRNITIADSANGSLEMTSGSTATSGETASFKIKPSSGYNIDKIKLTDSNDNDLDTTVTFDAIQGQFIMPDSDVKIVASFKKDEDAKDNYSVLAVTSSDEYIVKDNNFTDLTKATEYKSGSTLFFTVANDSGNSFWIYATMGENQIINQQADEDPDTGEYGFQKSFTVNGDIKICVSDTEANAKALATKDTTVKFSVLAKVSDADEFTVKDYKYKDLTANGITYEKDSTLGFTVTDDYGESFWVVTYVDNVITIDKQATEDPDSGEYTFQASFAVTGNVVIKIASTSAAAKAL